MIKNPLRAAIVGGGIGGVAAANALLARGMDVRIYEQAPALTEVGAGVAIQPNGVRMLRRLGLGDELARWGARWVDPQFRRPDGAYAAAMWPPELASQIELFGVHRADLLAMLVDRLPADIVNTGHRCVGFEQDDNEAVITFANGARATADVVIAADGIHSTLQQFVVTPSAPLFSGSVACRGVVPAASVSWPPGAMRNWLGAGKHFLVFPVRAGELINYVGFVRADEEMKESWSAPGDPDVLRREFAGWDPRIGSLLEHVQTTFRWALYDREPLASWSLGRLTLLGDAAHPMLPHLGQGANQSIEDGMALATILARANRATAPAALLAYQHLRLERVAQVQHGARENGLRYDSANPDLGARDAEIKAQAAFRMRLYDHDVVPEAQATAMPLP